MRWKSRERRNNDSSGKPEKWFAWYPVKLDDRSGEVAWLEVVDRVKVTISGGVEYEWLYFGIGARQ